MSKGAVLLKTTRLPFLILTPIYVFLGVALALANGVLVDPWSVSCILIAAAFSHVSVNCLNEYADFKSGLDFHTEKTPFSGGSGALPGCPEMAEQVLLVGFPRDATASTPLPRR